MSISRLLKQLREDAGLSQQDVARKLGMARATYANLEAGRREPDLGELKAIAELYEISMMELIAEEGDDWPGVVSEPEVEYRRSAKLSEKRSGASGTNHDGVLREVLLYILGEVGARPNFGESTLYKLLFIIDTGYLNNYGTTITGLRYVSSRFGPMPTKTFAAIVKRMETDGELEIITTKHYNNTQKKYLPVRSARLDGLSANEWLHITKSLALLGDKSPEELDNLITQEQASGM